MKRSLIIKIAIAIALILASLISFGSKVYADDSTTRSIVGDWFNKVFEIKLNDGKGLMETEQDEINRESINESIYSGTVDQNYSLYDRFGGSIKFIPYFGEIKISTGLLDRFYTKFVENNKDFTLSAQDISKFFESSAISNNVAYENRPNILSSESIEAGRMDPRVYAYSGMSSIGGDAALGNLMLSISNFFTTVISWLSGNGLYGTINDIWQTACDNGLKSILQTAVWFFLPLSICIFVISLVSKSIKVTKGTLSGRKLIEHLASSMISLGLIFSLMSNPTSFSNVLKTLISSFDSVLDVAIVLDASEVVQSDITRNIRTATLWDKSVFQPWCYGMFGENYESLYTQYDTNPNHIKMPQSNDDVMSVWNDGTIKYNSASLTGDVKVRVGKDRYVRNWAALAWSAQSIYHIDAVDPIENDENSIDDGTVIEVEEIEERKVWPRAKTTPMNDSIFVDNFRWLDAMLNISPEYHSPEDIIMSYSNSNNYRQNFVSAGIKSLYMTSLLIPIAILTVRKLVNAIKIVSYGFRWVLQCLLNIIMPNRYSIIKNFSSLIRPIYDFFWWSMVIFLGITVYTKLAGNGAIGDFLWILVGIWLCKFRPIRTPMQLRGALYSIKNKTLNKLKNLVNQASSKLERKN